MWSICIFFLTFLVSFLFARFALGTQYFDYDDEGYLLLSVKHYMAGEHLYTQVFTQYGPFYYLVEGSLLRILHLPVTHDSGRLLTMVLWLLSSAAFTYFVYKLSRNTLLAAAAGIVGTGLTRVLATEPNHPQQVALPMLVLACCLSLTPTPAAVALLAALGVALVLTKINIGVFYLAALFGTLACGLPRGVLRTIAIGFVGAYLMLFPPLLMHRDLATWAGWYCLVAVLCGLSTLTVGGVTSPEMEESWRACLYGIVGGLVATVLICGATVVQGVSIRTLFHGVVLDPLRRSGKFEFGIGVSRRETAFAILITVAVALVWWLRRRTETYRIILSSSQIIAGICGVLLLFDNTMLHPLMMAALPLALLPPAGGRWRPADYFPRLFVTLLSATQFLQPYPVEGSQCAIAAVPLLLWSFVCLYDGVKGGLAEVAERRLGGLLNGPSLLSLIGGVAFVLFSWRLLMAGAWRYRFLNPPSSLQGSHNLHLPEARENVYVPIASEIHANCDVLFTMPGMGSFNFWSGVPSPNGFNLTAWITEFTPEEQAPILSILRANPRSCVLYKPSLFAVWSVTQRDVEASPLATYIANDMRTAYQRGDYQIRVSPARTTPWVVTIPSSHS